MSNPYQILEIPEGSSPEQVREAYRLLAFAWHPDRFAPESPWRDEATRRFSRIQKAYRSIRQGATTAQATPSRSGLPGAPAPPRPRRLSRPAPSGMSRFVLAALLIASGWMLAAGWTAPRQERTPSPSTESTSQIFTRPEYEAAPSPIGPDGLSLQRSIPLGFVRSVARPMSR